MIERISAVTLATHDMARAVAFYKGLGFKLGKGGEEAAFTTFHIGPNSLNLIAEDTSTQWWGRVIFYVHDVDKMHAQVIDAGVTPEFSPRDADWGERYFHVTDPDGHELSFAKPL